MDVAEHRTILHADLDAFYAAVEQRDDPRLRGRPVVVGGMGRRGVVSTASYEARRFGVRSAMPGSEARRRCPDAVFVSPRMEVYLREAQVVREVFESLTPLVEPLSLDEAFLDVTGSAALFGDGPAIAARLRAEVLERTGLTVSVGVAANKFVAKVASDLRKPDALVVVPAGTEAAFLAPLGVERLWGAGPVTVDRLRALGLATVGELADFPAQLLAARIGERAARHLQCLARGEDDRPVVPDREAKSISRETTFERDLRDDEACHRVLLELAESVGRRLRRAGKRSASVRLKVRFPPFRTVTRQAAVDPPTDDDLQIAALARRLLGQVRSSRQPVRLLGVGAAELIDGDVPRQGSLFGEDAPAVDPRRARLTQAVDDLRERFGDGVIRRGG